MFYKRKMRRVLSIQYVNIFEPTKWTPCTISSVKPKVNNSPRSNNISG